MLLHHLTIEYSKDGGRWKAEDKSERLTSLGHVSVKPGKIKTEQNKGSSMWSGGEREREEILKRVADSSEHIFYETLGLSFRSALKHLGVIKASRGGRRPGSWSPRLAPRSVAVWSR